MRRLLVLGLVCALGGCVSFEPSGRRYAVYFQEWSASLDDGGKATVAQAAAWANSHPNGEVHVVGYADPEGTPQANRDLSRTRAQVVADGLAAGGVAPPRIRIEGAGAVGYAMDPQESRRVTISLGTP
jgi:outer membrane protein OmpA-like peptidoglycan-associated protein